MDNRDEPAAVAATVGDAVVLGFDDDIFQCAGLSQFKLGGLCPGNELLYDEAVLCLGQGWPHGGACGRYQEEGQTFEYALSVAGGVAAAHIVADLLNTKMGNQILNQFRGAVAAVLIIATLAA